MIKLEVFLSKDGNYYTMNPITRYTIKALLFFLLGLVVDVIAVFVISKVEIS